MSFVQEKAAQGRRELQAFFFFLILVKWVNFKSIYSRMHCHRHNWKATKVYALVFAFKWIKTLKAVQVGVWEAHFLASSQKQAEICRFRHSRRLLLQAMSPSHNPSSSTALEPATGTAFPGHVGDSGQSVCSLYMQWLPKWRNTDGPTNPVS